MVSPPSSLPLSRLLGLTADAVAAVRAGRSLTDLLTAAPPEARPGMQSLCFHVLRRLGAATEARRLMAPKPPPAPVDSLLTTAIALAWPDGEPPYAPHTLVDQAVGAARQRMPAAAGFVNAVLRRFLRERDALVAAATRQPEAAFNHPLWWIERLRRDWPDHWQALLLAANAHPPMTLRVNVRHGPAEQYVERLAAAGRPALAVGGATVVLGKPCSVDQLPGWVDGDVSVQDAAAQRAATLLLGATANAPALAAGARVLDACAAPGGKTAHLLELAAIDLLALDSDARRLARVGDALKRLRLPAQGAVVELKAGDAGEPAGWWDGRPFDAILLDAPCTASGIVRRHPDIRWLRRPEDVAALARTQARLLDALWPLLRPGGRLLYATCSVFKAEGAAQIDAFLQRHANSPPRLDPAAPGHLLPLADNGSRPSGAVPAADGFFYALLHRP